MNTLLKSANTKPYDGRRTTTILGVLVSQWRRRLVGPQCRLRYEYVEEQYLRN